MAVASPGSLYWLLPGFWGAANEDQLTSCPRLMGTPQRPINCFLFAPITGSPLFLSTTGICLLVCYKCGCASVCVHMHTWTRRVGVKVMGAQATWTSGGSPRCSSVCFSSGWAGSMDKCPEDISGTGIQSLTSHFELLPEIGLRVPPSFLIFYAITVLSFMVSLDLAISAVVRDGQLGIQGPEWLPNGFGDCPETRSSSSANA